MVRNYTGQLEDDRTLATITETLLSLSQDIDNGLKDTSHIAEHARDFRADIDNLDKSKKNGPEYSQKLLGYIQTQERRVQYVPLLEALKKEQSERQVITFGEQMAVAARVARDHPVVGKQQSQRYKVVMLDEYQDTSYAQRVLLRSLFGGEKDELLSLIHI